MAERKGVLGGAFKVVDVGLSRVEVFENLSACRFRGDVLGVFMNLCAYDA